MTLYTLDLQSQNKLNSVLVTRINSKMEDKKEKKTSMKDRLSKFLGIPIEEKSGPDLPEIIKVYEQSKEADKKIIAEILKTLNKSNPLDVRIAIVKDFCAFIRSHRVDDPRIVRSLWVAFEDFFNEHRPREFHKAGFTMMQAMIEGQYERLQLLRPEFFRVIQRSSGSFAEKYLSMLALTNRGRDISPFENEIGSLYSEWLNIEVDHIKPLLELATKTIKYSFALIDEPNKDLIIRRVCEISNSATDVDVVERCLNLLEVLAIHGTIPATCLMPIISSLCRSVNIERFSTISWQIMYAVLQTHWGYQGIKCLCALLDDTNNRSMVNLLRGAVFFLSMSVWGFQKVPNLNVSATTILPSLLKVLSSRQFIVAYEVVLGVKRLVKKYGGEMKVEWNVIFNILYSLKSFMSSTPVNENTSLVVTVREILTMIEEWYKKGQFFGDDKLLFQLLETYAIYRPEESTFFIMDKKIEEINPANERWLDSLERLITIFFVNDRRIRVREKAFNVLRQKFETFKFLYGPEIAQKAIVSNFSMLHTETDPAIRDMSIAFLVNVAENLYSSQFFQIIDMIYQLAANAAASTETRLMATTGLLNVFKTKFPFKRYNQTLYIFEKLVNLVSDDEFVVRKEVLSKLLQIRANERFEIVLEGVTCIYLRCVQSNRTSIGMFPMTNFYTALVKRLRKENRNEVFVMLARGLHQMLTNHWIMNGIDLTETASLVARLLENKIFGMPVDHLPISETAKFENFQLGYELLTLMIGYLAPNSPSMQIQEDIVSCFHSGIAYKWSCPPEIKQSLLRTCLNSLSICVSEISDGVTKFLTQILSSIQQVAHNMPDLAMPVLEWFNALVSFPELIKKCLLPNDFKPIIGVLLQFTDYVKHSPVTVTFAYQVLALWYLQVERRQRHLFFPTIRDSLLEQIKTNKSLIAEANCDLFARYTFTDCDPLPTAEEESNENSVVFKNSSTRVWVQGNSLIGIKTGQMGWVEVVLRQATGKMVWLMQLKNKIRKSGDKELAEDDFDTFLQQLRSSMAAEGISLDESDDLSDLEGSGDIALTDSGDITDRLRQSDSPDVPETVKTPLARVNLKAMNSPSSEYKHAGGTSTTVTDTATNTSLPLSPRGLNSQPHSMTSPRSIGQGSSVTSPPSNIAVYHSVTSPKFGSMTSPLMSPSLVPIKSPTGLSEPFSLTPDQGSQRPKSGEMVLPLSVFYPPLPSYEEEERERRGSIGGPVDENMLGRSPSFFHSLEDMSIPKGSIKGQESSDLVQNSKLSLDAQMILHASPVKNIPPRVDRPLASENDNNTARRRTPPFDIETPAFEEPTLTLTRRTLVLDTPRDTADNYGSPPNVNNSTVTNHDVNTSQDQAQPIGQTKSTSQPLPTTQSSSKLSVIQEVSEDSGSSTNSSPQTPSSTPKVTSINVSSPSSSNTTPQKENAGQGQQQQLNVGKTVPAFKRLTQSADKARSGSDSAAIKKIAEDVQHQQNASSYGQVQNQPVLSHSYTTAKHHRASISSYSNAGGSGPNPAQIHRTFSQEVRKTSLAPNPQSLSGEWKLTSSNSNENVPGPHDKDLLIHPSFVFLQLQQTPFYSSKPKLLKNSESITRALFILDHTMSCETHKFGVVYVDAGQSKQDQILKNTFGSARYTSFLKELGEIIRIQDINSLNSAYQYTGGLDRSGQDGEYAITWRDDVTQVMFHVVTLMPNLPSDQYFTNKKRHIGNDYVNIVWCEGGQQYDLDTITGQFTFVAIVISPLKAPFYRIEVKKKPEIPYFGPVSKSTVVEEKNLAFLVRQTAINANLAARVHMLQQKFLQYVSNCEERLRQIKTIEERFASDEKVDFLSG